MPDPTGKWTLRFRRSSWPSTNPTTMARTTRYRTPCHRAEWLMTFARENPRGYWPVYKEASFNLWNPDTGDYYAWADPEPVLEWLQSKRMRGANNKRSPHHEFQKECLSDQSTLPCFAPRIAFRDVTNRTNQRTVIACLVPPQVFITNKGPYFLWPRGDEKNQAFCLAFCAQFRSTGMHGVLLRQISITSSSTLFRYPVLPPTTRNGGES